VSKDVRIRGYFEKPKEVCEKQNFGKHCSSALKLTILPVNTID